MLSGYDPEPVREQDSQLLGRLPPVLHRLGPLLPDSRKCKIYKFSQCDIRCKHALILGYLTELALIAFHGILCFCRWRTGLWFCPQVNPQGSFHVCVQLGNWKYRPGRAVCLWSLLPSRSVHACSCGRGGGYSIRVHLLPNGCPFLPLGHCWADSPTAVPILHPCRKEGHRPSIVQCIRFELFKIKWITHN